MIKIIVASKNPVKIEAALQGFREMFPKETFEAEGVSVASGVSDQPVGDEETYQGALNRVKGAKANYPDAQYWIGIEGGNLHTPHGVETMAWVIVRSGERLGKARTAGFYLPPKVVELLDQGYELGHADDIVFGVDNSKQSTGSAGLLTGGVMDRLRFYVPAIILALIPFKQPALYPMEDLEV